MANRVRYALTYRKLEESITLDNFESLYAALDYCLKEGIQEPVSIIRREIIEEQVLSRSQIISLLNPGD